MGLNFLVSSCGERKKSQKKRTILEIEMSLFKSCTVRAWVRRTRLEMRLFDGRGPKYSTITRLRLVGSLPLAGQPDAICLCTVL